MDKKDIFDKIMNLPLLNIFKPFYSKHKETLLYLFFGGLSFVLNMLLYYSITELLKINVLISNIITWIIIVAFCFITNKKWVFNDTSSTNKSLLSQIVSFYASRLITLCVEEIILFIFITRLQLNSLIIKIIAQIIVIILNYVFSKLIIFRKEK